MLIENNGASTEAIQSHYDVSNNFYKLWLDPTMTYSCPLWGDGDTLEQAQKRKYQYHIDQACVKTTSRVLDVGCGWGGLLKHLSLSTGAESVTGLTLSQAQLNYINDSLNLPRTEAKLCSWKDHKPEAEYNSIISIGAFEHFASYGISQKEKLNCYRNFFEKMHEITTPGANISLQTMAYGRISRKSVHKDLFIAEEIFPESDFPRLSDIAQSSEMLFEIKQCRNDRMDYSKAYRQWFNNLKQNKSEAESIVGYESVKKYLRYLRTFSYSFELGAFELLRITMKRIDGYRQPLS